MNDFTITPNAQNLNVQNDIFVSAQSAAQPAASAPAPEQSPKEQPKQPSIYGEIPQIPTQDAVEGIKFDFNDGIRILFPHNGKEYHVTFTDIDTGIILFSQDTVPGAYVTSVKKFFIRFRLIIHDKGGKEPIFTHDFDAKDREVMIQLPVGTIGDSIGWFSYVERFQIKHQCKLVCVMTPWIAEVVRKQYPNITFIAPEETKNYKPYACYYMGLFFRGDVDHQPIDFRYIGLHRTAGYILGVDPADEPPRFDLSAPRKIKEKYVCIAVQSTSLAKMWNNPGGWRIVVDFLKQKGYRVLCIDKASFTGKAGTYTYMPPNAEDFTGDRPLQERIDLIKDADFFIGLSSGLSWLAWGCRVPIVMISGFTAPWNEFHTPYRIINYNVCNSCWNDFKDFDLSNYWHCPRLENTDRQFECSAMISPDRVIDAVTQLLQDHSAADDNFKKQANK